jgi:REP element-mobilizing transposase RayT
MKQHPHDRKYLRLKHFDYSQEGAYFVTICTNARKLYFKKYPNLKPIIQDTWNSLEVRFPLIELDEFVVMPNHVHGIVFIMGGNEFGDDGATSELPLQKPHLQIPHQRRQIMLLSKVIGYFKMNTAKQINQLLKRSGQPFWQRSYYEHVVRNENELNKIREYIQNNPLKWKLDRENPESKNFDSDHDSYWKEIYCRDNS